MKKILSIFAVILCLSACSNDINTMSYDEILNKEGLCNDFEGIDSIVVKQVCEHEEGSLIKICKTVIEMTICKDGTKIIK